MPSLFEGIPLTGVEAQFAGLLCIFSDKVPKEVEFSDHCFFLSLGENDHIWSSTIKNTMMLDRKIPINAEYDIKYAHKILEDYYYSLIGQRGEVSYEYA